MKADPNSRERRIDRRSFLTTTAKVAGVATASLIVPRVWTKSFADAADDGTTPIVTITAGKVR